MSIIQSVHSVPTLPRSSLFDYIFPGVGNYDDTAFIDGLTGRTVTRGQVHDHALRLAGGLQRLGLKRGDVACIHALNSIEWINALMGCQAARVIVSPANYAYTPGELLHQLQDSGASLVFVDPALVVNLQNSLKLQGAPQIPTSRIVLLCPLAQKPSSEFQCIEELWSDPIDSMAVKGEEEETTVLCYSSGTTGRGKGVETTHYNLTSQLQALNVAAEPLHPKRDMTIGFLPFGHMYLFSTGVLANLAIGVPMVILPRFAEIPVLEAIQKYRVTWALVVPPVLISLLNSTHAPLYDLSSLRAVMSAAAPLGNEVVVAFENKFKVWITQAYGLTEVSPISHIMTVEEAKTRPGKIGRLLPTFEARIVGDSPERGELWMAGPSVMKGYWRNPTATTNTFEGRWFKTGDIAIKDHEGYFSIVDRVKELIKYKGFQVAPAELESLLLSHDKVADAAVIGIESPSQGTELPRAYIVPSSSVNPGEKETLPSEIVEWVAEHVANHKRLRGGVVLLDVIPKTASGKILRKDLRASAHKEITAKL